MRFLMLNWRDPKNPAAGGAERVSEAYLRALHKRGHEVYWFSHDFPGALAEENYAGIHILRAGNAATAMWHAKRWYHAQSLPFDLVIDQHHGIPWYAPWWCRTRCLAYLHEVLGPIWNAFYSPPLSWLGRLQERVNYHLYRNVPFWTPCRSTAETLKSFGVKEVTVIPNGIGIRAVPTLDPKPLTLPLQLAMVSRLAPNKRLDHGIETLKELHRHGVKACLTLVGRGNEETRLRRLVARLQLEPYCDFRGYLPEDEKNEVLRRSHWLLHTSLREGWGLNVLEANAVGTPAAVYPVPGLVDSTRHQETGIVAPTESPQALAKALIEMIDSDPAYQRLRHNAWQFADSLHWDHVLPQACDWLERQACPPEHATGSIPTHSRPTKPG